MVDTTAPLPRGLQMFNQQLMAKHCLTKKEAIALLESLPDLPKGSSSFADCIAMSNAQLQLAGLEIAAVVFQNETYYAMVNKFPDEISKACFQAMFATPQQQQFVRLVFETLTTQGNATKTELINLRTQLEDSSKLSLTMAEDTVQQLMEECWIMTVSSSSSSRSQMQLAPRAYLELSYLLVDEFGMDKKQLPQQIYHRN